MGHLIIVAVGVPQEQSLKLMTFETFDPSDEKIKHDLASKKANTETNTITKTNRKTYTKTNAKTNANTNK